MDVATYRLIVLCALAATVLTPGTAGGVAGTFGAKAEVDVSCYSCLVLDDRGATLFARRSGTPLPNASTTKMLTALVAVRHLDLDRPVEVSAAAAAVPGGRLSLLPRERWSVEDLLYGLLLGSSNDAAVALAEEVAGSEGAFVELMAEEAQRLEALDTVVRTSHGLDAPGHVTTARDLVTIATALLADPVLAPIVAKRSATIAGSERTVTVSNTNELIGSYRGAIGVKTGFTSDAGNVLVAAARRQERTVVVVAMRAEDAFEDARRMLDFAFKKLRRGILLKAMTSLGDLVFVPSGSTGAVAQASLRGIANPEEITVELIPDARVTPPIARGQRIGTAIVRGVNGRSLGSVPAVATRAVGEVVGESWIGSALAGVLKTASGLVGEP